MEHPDNERDLDDLMHHDQADVALEEAIKLGDLQTANAAARIVLLSGGYSDESKKLAAKYNRDPDITAVRKKYLE